MRVMIKNLEDGIISTSVHEISNIAECDTLPLNAVENEEGCYVECPNLWFSNNAEGVEFCLIGLQSRWNDILCTALRDGFVDISEFSNNIIYCPDVKDKELVKTIVDNDRHSASLFEAAYEAMPRR